MKVVSNTSPLSNLCAIGHLNLLRELYEAILIPHAVAQELSVCSNPDIAQIVQREDAWIQVYQVRNKQFVHALLSALDLGEAEAIALCLDTRADLLLMDEKVGRDVATKIGLPFTGVLGVLLEAKSCKLIPAVKPCLDDLIVKAGFRLRHTLYEYVLESADEK
jgi:predicted nucleic acid-binding protein